MDMSENIINETVTHDIDFKVPQQEFQQTEYATESVIPSKKQAKSFSQKLSLIFASIALGSDGYQANVIGAVKSCLGQIYGSKVLTSNLSTRVSNAMLIGDIVGQLGFGVIIDRLGRKFGIVACTFFVCLVRIIALCPIKEIVLNFFNAII
jgi:MFS family permease